MKKIKCPMCNERFTKIDSLYSHMEDDHGDDIPKDMSPAQYAYMLRTGKSHGTCIVCKKDTGWNENTGKYKRFCEDKKCKEKYREQFKVRMIGKYGKTTLLNDPEHQKKMLAHRHISGEYKWSDGSIKTYTGSYELDFLKMLDAFMQFDSSDIITPSPHTYYYTYKNEKKFYIPDAYIPSLSLEIEVKDGGNNPNTHHKIQDVDKVKERLKDEVMKSQTNVDYIKIVNKNYDEFFTYLLDKKIEDMDSKDVKFSSDVRITNESVNNTIDDFEISTEALDLNKKYKPVFIILTEGHTPIVSDGIRHFTNSTYTHVSIAFDHILNEIYSFNFRKEGFGFVKETKDYFKSNMITIYSFFVPIDGYEKMKDTVLDFKTHSTMFDFRIFANKMLNINKKVSDDKYKQVCSTFVDTVLKAANINLFDDNELPAPADFFTAAENKKTKIFKVYKGLIKDYNPKAIYKRVYRYMHNKKTEDIYATESFVLESNNNRTDVKNEIEKTKNKYVIKNDKGDVISKLGYYRYNVKNFDWILIADVETKPEYRGKGLASKLINTLYSDITKEDPGKGLYLFVRTDNDVAIKLYKKLNFKTVKKYKLDDGWYYIMCKGKADISQFDNMKFR